MPNPLQSFAEIKPTPRNKLMGLVADALTRANEFATMQDPRYADKRQNQTLGIIADALSLGSLAKTADRLSYGDALTNAKVTNVPFLKPETADALMMAPLSPRTALSAMGMGMGDNALMKAATVWHGSPHKFDKFDASKIGTGEGAQAYGHGLYLAESPSVAKSYADTLSQYHIGTRDGVKSGGDFADALVANTGDYPASLSSAIRSQANKIATALAGGKTAEQVIASMRNGPYARMYSGLADAVEKMSPTKAGGNLYKVDLPDEKIARMLDWDKPLSQQAPEVRRYFEPKVAPIRSEMAKPADPGWGDLAAPSVYDPTGQELLGLLRNRDAQLSAQSFLSNGLGHDVSKQLRQSGIPGIRYLDGGSRGAGAGSSNYVVFPGEEEALKILERNGIPMPSSAGKSAFPLSYQIDHKPMTKAGGAATLDDLIPAFGEDIYGKNALQFFGSGDARERNVVKTLSALRGKPNAPVTIYRGVPKDVNGINAGDWVTLDAKVAADYAAQHPGGKVISMQVPASHVTSWADSLLEFGYHPQK